MKQKIIILLTVALMITCGRKWKLTAPVTFLFSTELTEFNNDEVEIQDGTLHFLNVACSGKREKGADVEFSNALNDEKSIQEQSYTLNFDLPQGTYKDLEIEYTIGGNTQINIEIKDSVIKDINARIYIKNPVTLKVRLSDVSISKDKNYTFLFKWDEKMLTNFVFYRKSINEYAYDNELNMEYVPISENKNPELYNQIIKALQDNFILSVN